MTDSITATDHATPDTAGTRDTSADGAASGAAASHRTEGAVTGVDHRPLTSRGLRTRAKLLAAAEDVFGEHGFHDASIVKITESAGVAQGTFYLYFESKQQIFEELVLDLNRQVRRAMTDAARQGATRSERERAGFAAYFGFVAQHSGLYHIFRQIEIVSPSLLHRHYEQISAGYAAGLREAMDDGEISHADPEVLAWMLMGIGEFVGSRWLLWGDSETVPEHVFEQMMAFITRGLGTGAPPP